MPSLHWIGKEAVVNHHQTVPFHLLRDVPELSVGEPGAGNLIVQGDNLVALKALLPYYAGQVKCIYIDPPYNTGEENWIYNDNVNSPIIREWLGKVVGKENEDLSRHDKWLCLMYPRLSLMRRLLSRDGLIAVSIDDHEVHSLGWLMDHFFGRANRLACAPWLAEPSGGKGKSALRVGHAYLLVYHGGDASSLAFEERSVGNLDKSDSWGKYRKGRELRKWGGESLRADREEMWFPIRAPDGSNALPYRNDGKEGRWRWGREGKMLEVLNEPERAHWEQCPYDEGIVVNGARERWVPFEKVRDKKKVFGWSTWLDAHGFNADGTRELKDIFGHKPFDTPKPVSLLKWVISLHSDENALVLDSFAGSATTAHAVMALNEEDDGGRRFILVEVEPNIATEITAERIKRVSQGYTNAKGERVEGLGGGFRFCGLGEPLFDAAGQIRESVTFAELARHVYFTETGESLPRERVSKSPLIGECRGVAVYLLFNGILGDRTANGGNVLTRAVLGRLPRFDGPKVVYASGCLLGRDRLQAERITFRQTPYEIKVA